MAGSLSKRDIELLFRAETDGATRDIKSLTGTVKSLRETLVQQTAAAEKGQGSLEAIAETTRELKKAQDELGTARGLLTALNSQEAALERAQTRTAKLSGELADLQKQIDATDKPTKRLTNSYNAKSKALDAARAKEEAESKALAETRTQIEGIIGPVENFEASFQDIATASKDIARGLAVAGEAADTFKAKMKSAADANAQVEKELAAGVAFEQQGRAGGLTQAQIDYISQFENRAELLAQAMREVKAQSAGFDQAVAAQEARVGAANVERLRQEITDTFAAAERLEQLTAFQRLAQEARAASADVGKFASSFDASTAVRFADAIQAIQNPARAAAETIDGISAAVDRAEATLNGKYKPTVAAAANEANNLSQAQAGLQRVAAQVDGLRAQEVAAANAQQAYADARAEVDRLAAEIEKATEPNDQLARSLKQAEAAVDQTGRAMQKESTQLDALRDKAAKAGIEVNDLAKTEKDLEAAARRAADAQGKLGDVTGSSGKKGFLGLQPHELQNLSFQLNDVFTSLSSGISIQQTAAQQGGQIFQIFQGRILAFLPTLLRLIPVFAALTVGIIAFSRAASEAADLRDFQGTLDSLGETNGNTAQGLQNVAKSLRDVGANSKDANAAVKQFVQDGMNPDALHDFGVAAANTAEVTGKTLPEAARELSTAFTGSTDSLLKNQLVMGTLTDAEQAQAVAMVQSGKDSEAREFIFDRYFAKMAKAAQDMEGPWASATRTLNTAWHGLLDTIGNSTVIQTTVGIIEGAIKRFAFLINLVSEITNRASALDKQIRAGKTSFGPDTSLSGAVDAANARTNTAFNARNQRTNPKAGSAAGQQYDIAGGAKAVEQARLQNQLAKAGVDLNNKKNRALAEEATRQIALNNARDAGYSVADQQKLADFAVDSLRERYAKKDKTRDDAAAKRKQQQAEELAKQYAAAQDSLDNALGRMNAAALKASGGTIEEQVAAARKAVDEQYTSLYNQLAEFQKKFGATATIHGMTQDAYKQQLQDNQQILADQAEMQTREQGINDIISARSKAVQEIENKIQAGALDPTQGFQQITEVTSKINTDLLAAIDKARTFALTLKPSPETQKFLAQLDQAAGAAGAGGLNQQNRQAFQTINGQQENELNKIISERNSLIQTNNQLVKLGVLTQTDAQNQARAAYAATSVEINKQIEAQKSLLAAALQSKSITQTGYDAAIAKLNLLGQQAQYTDQRYVQLRESMNQLINQQFMQFIDSIAQTLANVADGTESVTDGLKDIALAFVKFIAQTLIGIGELIIQALILSAIDKATGGIISGLLAFYKATGGSSSSGVGGILGMKHNGGTVGSYSGGVQSTSRVGVTPAMIAAAPRYHDGTPGVGLSSNEQLAVLERGEKVVTEEQQRREAAAQGSGGGAPNGIRQVLAFGDDQIAGSMASSAGEQVVLTHIKRNGPTIKQMLDQS
jgi:hypothetical protein